MKLVELYLNQVGEHLPEKMRKDVLAEMRSLIEDTLEGRAETSGRSPEDENLVVEVLKEFGSPQKMAASYLPQRYLIGPRLFPTFWMVIKIVLGILLIVSAVRLGVSLIQTPAVMDAILGVIGKSLIEFFTSGLSLLGNVVFVFALLEYFIPKAEFDKQKPWNPRSLEDKPEQVVIPPAEILLGIALNIIVILVFNLYPQWIGLVTVYAGKWVFFPILSAAFFQYLPWLTVMWVLEIVRDICLLRFKQPTEWLTWVGIGLKVFSIVILGAMALGAPIVELSPEALANADLAKLAPLAASGLRGLLVLLIVLQGADLVKQVVRMAKK
jgi:hypothetical protein